MGSFRSSIPSSIPAVDSVVESLPRQFGKYTLLRELASGGMARVYLAIQRSVAGFEKLVVIKRILPELARDTDFVEMLLTEARTAATLDHPNVVQTFDVGEVEGTYYIAMEYINGEDIRSIVRGMKRSEVREFPLEHTLSIVRGVCAGLAYAHEKKDLEGNALNIVHRDISPQNILVTYSGAVKVVDFGIAKSTEAVGEKTGAGQLKGKAPYMSPEQARSVELDHRSDIFAVGIVLFELTTGRRLFKAKSEFETLKMIVERPYPSPREIVPNYPQDLERIVMRALEKEPARRYQKARDMQADLEAFARHERIATSAVGLADWMAMLFADKIEQQKHVMQDAKRLADVVASQHSIAPMSEPGSLYSLSAMGTNTAAVSTMLRADTLPPPAPRRAWRWGVLALGLAGLGAGAFFVTRLPQQAPMTAPTSTAASAVAPEPEVKKGTLKVSSEPAGAYLRVAGELHSSKTPAELSRLPLGIDIEIKVSLEGYEDHVRMVKLSEDKLDDSIEVKLTRGSATLVFEVEPAKVMVVLDGKTWEGEGNRIEGLSAGDHKVVFSAPGRAPGVVKFVAEKGKTRTIELTLGKKGASSSGGKPKAKGNGTVNVASRGGFCQNTIVGGKSVGPTPVAGIAVPAGPVSIVCKLADGRSVPSGAVVKDGQTARVTIQIPKAE
jgi:serine/threonine-protein kinase